jgi:hypothetical protein
MAMAEPLTVMDVGDSVPSVTVVEGVVGLLFPPQAAGSKASTQMASPCSLVFLLEDFNAVSEKT